MKVLEIQTWIDMFDPSEINLDKLEEYLGFIKEAVKNYDSGRYSEWHHVMPRCLDENHTYDNEGVRINGSDHFRAHMKLVECFNGVKRHKLSCALIRMRGSIKDITPEEWEEARRIYSKSVSDSYTGESNPFYGKKHSEETRKRISKTTSTSLSGRIFTEEHCTNISKNHADVSGKNNPMYGKHHTEESRKKMSEHSPDRSGSNNPMYGVHRYGQDAPSYGKHWTLSEEVRGHISEGQKGKVLSEEVKTKISQSRIGMKSITDGISNKYIKPDDLLPDGWRYGRTNKPRKYNGFATES